MSYLSQMFGPIEDPPKNVKVGAWVLCPACSRGRHTDCERPCHCDLPGCQEES